MTTDVAKQNTPLLSDVKRTTDSQMFKVWNNKKYTTINVPSGLISIQHSLFHTHFFVTDLRNINELGSISGLTNFGTEINMRITSPEETHGT